MDVICRSLLLITFFLGRSVALAGNQSLVYQGRIVRPNGDLINAGNLTFSLSVYSPSDTHCLLYSETQTVDMTGTHGMFSLSVGRGTRTDGGSHSFSKIFVNGGSLSGLTCATGTTYSPSSTDERFLEVSFADGTQTVTLRSMPITSVPFALQAHEIDGWGVNNLVKVSTVGSPTTFTTTEMANAKSMTGADCAVNELLKWNGTSWACAADITTGVATEAGYTSANKGILAFDTDAATSGISISSGIAKLSNTGVTAATYGSASKVSSVAINAQGRVTSASEIAIAIPSSQITQSGANVGEVLKWDGTAWTPAADNTGTSPGDATYAAKGLVQGDTDAATSGLTISSGVISVNSGTAANQIVKLDASAKLPAVDGSQLTGITASQIPNLDAGKITTGVLPIARGGTNSGTALTNNKVMVSSGGAIVEGDGFGSTNVANTFIARDASGDFAAGAATLNSVKLNGSTSGTLTMTVPATVTDYTVKWPNAVGAAGSFLTTDASGNLSWGSPAAIADASYTVKGAVQFNNDAATSGISIASGVATVNTGTGNNQIVKLDGSAKLPAVDGSALTNLDPTHLSAAVPVNKGGTGQTTYTDGQILIGNSTGNTLAKSTLTAGSGVTITNGSGSITIAATGSGGTVTNVSSANTDISVATGTTTPVLTLNTGTGNNQIVKLDGSAKLPAVDGSALTNLNAGNISSGTLPVTRGGTGQTTFGNNGVIVSNGSGSALQSLNCTSGQIVTFDVSGYAVCGASPAASGFVNGGNSFGSNATLGTNDNYSLSFKTNNTSRMTILSTGEVGIGTSSPRFPLEMTANGGNAVFTFDGVVANTPYTPIEHSQGPFYSGVVSAIMAGGDTYGAYHAGVAQKYNEAAGEPNYYSLIGERMNNNGDWDNNSPGKVNNGDYLPGIGFAGQTATTMSIGASIQGRIDGTVGSGVLPTAIVFRNSTTNTGGQTEKMRISSSGAVGIGTSSPIGMLDVVASSNSSSSNYTFVKSRNILSTQGDGTTTFNYSGFETAAGNAQVRTFLTSQYETTYTGGGVGTVSNHPFSIYTNGMSNLRLTVSNSGNVGIGTSSPAALLNLNGGLGSIFQIGATTDSYYVSADSNNFSFHRAAGPSYISQSAVGGSLAFKTSNASVNDTQALTILSTGDIGIGATTPGAKLEIAGQIKITGGSPGAGKVLTSDATGLATWTTPSSSGGTVTSVASANSDIAVATGTTTPVLTLNSGTGNNQIVKLDGSAKLPAVDGSALTNLDPTHLSAAVPVNKGGTGQTSYTDGQLLIGNTTGNTLTKSTLTAGSGVTITNGNGSITIAATGSGGTVTSVTSTNSDISVATGTTTPALTLNTGTGNNQIVKLDGSAKLPAVDGSALTNLNAGNISSGTLPVTRGGTGVTSFGAGGVIVSNALGTALQALNCTSGQVITFNVSGYAICGSGAGSGFVNGGNSFGGNATLGTNDNYSLGFKTNNSVAMTITNAGDVGIGATSPSARLSVASSITSGDILNVTNADTGTGVIRGIASTLASGGASHAIEGNVSGSGYAVAVFGYASSTNAGSYATGVTGFTEGGSGIGVSGVANYRWGGYSSHGGDFQAYGPDSYGLYATNNATSGNAIAFYTTSANSPTGYAIYSAAGTNYMAGKVGVGTTSPAVALDVQGQIRTSTKNVTGGTTVDWNNGNTQYTTDSCQAYTLNNVMDGGSYTFVVKGGTSAQCTFSASGLTFHYTPTNAPTNAGTHTVYTLFRAGSDVYVSWTTGL